MAKPLNILIVTIYNDHFRFFSRVAKAFDLNANNFTIVTNKYSIIKEAGSDFKDIHPIKNFGNSRKEKYPEHLEIYSGTLNDESSQKLYSSTYNILEHLNSKKNFDLAFIWSGIRLIDATAKRFCKENNIKTLFFEIGNFPDKIFADPVGTNAQSALAKKPNILDSFEADEDDYSKWLNNYIEINIQHHSVPQSKGVAKIDIPKNLLDLYGVMIKRYQKFEPVLDFGKLKNKLFTKVGTFEYDKFDQTKEKYILYPMQVSDDAQILVNSKIGNVEALKIVAEEAKKKSLLLYVKPHPAERNNQHIREVFNLKKSLGFKFVKGNTLELIKNSEMVFTINSTVGLQGLLLGKKVTCLGSSFYKNFTEHQLKVYIQKYLLNADFWREHEISKSIIDTLMVRSKIEVR